MVMVYRASKWLHKWVGLLLLLFVVWMSASGILLNHPEVIRDVSVPRWLVPPQYRIQNWSRGALRTAVFSQADPRIGFIGGTQGVWRTGDGGHTFQHMARGFPESYIDRQTDSLVLYEEGPPRLFAGTRGGLFVCDVESENWQRIALPGTDERVQKIIRVSDRLLVFTSSHAYRGSLSADGFTVAPITMRPGGEPRASIPLVEVFFTLHSGKMWGLAGRLLFDVVGVAIIFFGVSGFLLWYWPGKLRRAQRSPKGAHSKTARATVGHYRWMFRYHLRLGIWLALPLLIIGGTGLFMRPPMLVALAFGELPRGLYPAALPDNPWHDRIRSALYDHVKDKLILETTDGFWAGSPDFKAPFERTASPGPVFVMGTTVFEPYGNGGYLVGSFSGLFHLERSTGRAVDLVEGRARDDLSTFRPGDTMTAGFVRLPGGDEFVVDHYAGIKPIGDAERAGRLAMPAEMARSFRMPLWNYLFELHNGRIFRDWLGSWYALVAPLGSLLFVILILTGIYDWVFLKTTARKAVAPAAGPRGECHHE